MDISTLDLYCRFTGGVLWVAFCIKEGLIIKIVTLDNTAIAVFQERYFASVEEEDHNEKAKVES